MIHYTCDRCKRQIDTAQKTRFIVRIETQSVSKDVLSGDSMDYELIKETSDVDFDDDMDQLNELHEFLESLHNDTFVDEEISSLNHEGHYDLCPECHQLFLLNPLGRDTMLALGFSNN